MHISVMICDDLEEERAAMARMVDSYGRRHGLAIQIEGAAGGEELLAQWAPGRWDLVFLDIFMPGLSGVETARRLRAADRTCALVLGWGRPTAPARWSLPPPARNTASRALSCR